MLKRIKLQICYNGKGFHGWQNQGELLTVQGTIENCLRDYLGHPISIYAASRTDAGVHARCQVAHCDIGVSVNAFKLRGFMNSMLKDKAIGIVSIGEVGDDFDSRRNAKEKLYTYSIHNHHYPPVLSLDTSWHVPKSLDVELMKIALCSLLGEHDFASFRHKDCQAVSSIRTLDDASISVECESLKLNFRAKSFLHNQIRIMVGTLKELGTGKIGPSNIKSILAACNRKFAGQTAPAKGLCLQNVKYQTKWEM